MNVQAPFGLRRDDLIVKDVHPDILRQGLDEYENWKAERAADVASASRASIELITATQAASREDGRIDESPVTVVTNPVDTSRPAGVRFGSLVHALIADVPLGDAGDGVLERLSLAHGRVLGATQEEIAAARESVAALLRHPLLRAAARAEREGQCYRETPVTYRLESGVLVEGFVDLAYRDGDSVVVVDFKTDGELEGPLERYQRLVSIYATAIKKTAGLPTQAFLMRV